mgnify:CR=1 FL=1
MAININPSTLRRLQQLASRLPPEKPAPRQSPEQVNQLVNDLLGLRGNRAEAERALREGTPEERGSTIAGLQAISARIRVGQLSFGQGQNLILEAVARNHPETLQNGFYTASGRDFPLVSYDQPESVQQLIQNLRGTGFDEAARVIEAESARRSGSTSPGVQAATATSAAPPPSVAQPTEADPFPVNSQADRQAQVQSLEAPLDGLLQQRLPSSDPEASPAAAPNPLLEASATVEPLPMRGRGFRGFR